MKKIVLAASILVAGIASASGADLAARPYTKAAPVMVAPPIFSWTGCYLGIEGGGNWGRAGTRAVSANPALSGLAITNDYNLSGGLAGGTAGCNYQVSSLVLGIEGDVSWTNKRGSANDILPFTVTSTNTLRERWFDTVRGRIGFAWDRVLLYGTAGGAFAGTATDVCTISACVSDSKTRSGWVAGGGVEFAAWDAWSVKVEYLHADFGSKSYIVTPVVIGPVTVITRDIKLTDDVVRVGLNYRFNWGNSPVVARY